jgi:2-oxoglutarate dehydrogenase E1 component
MHLRFSSKKLMSESLAEQLAASAMSGSNADFIEELYARFREDPRSVDPSWARYFSSLPGQPGAREGLAISAVAPTSEADCGPASAKQAAVSRLIQVYANRGHLVANLDPLGLTPRTMPYILDPAYFGLSEAPNSRMSPTPRSASGFRTIFRPSVCSTASAPTRRKTFSGS